MLLTITFQLQDFIPTSAEVNAYSRDGQIFPPESHREHS